MAEGGGLLNRYTVKSCIGGSNPPLSARNDLRRFRHDHLSSNPTDFVGSTAVAASALTHVAFARSALSMIWRSNFLGFDKGEG